MKNTIFKSIFALFMAFMVLPMMGQDWMEIHFKDGTYRKFYLKYVIDLSPSKYDLNGVQHKDYDFQRVVTNDDIFVYKLSDVDSISFTKYEEVVAQKNYADAMTVVFNVLSNNPTIADVIDHLSEIKQSESIENVWIDGDQLFVKVKGFNVVPFHFSHEPDNFDTYQTTLNSSKIKSMLSLTNEGYISSDGKQLKAVLAIQTNFDESCAYERDNLYKPLLSDFEQANINVHYNERPTVDFFYDNSTDPDNLNIYDYDLIFLDTHGHYDRNTGIHSFETAEILGAVSMEHYASPKESDLTGSLNMLDLLRKKYDGVTEDDIIISCNEEKDKNNISRWILHPSLTENFFRYRAKGNFVNPNSILFNCACESLKGNEMHSTFGTDKQVPSNYSLANTFIDKGLGVYLGYNEKNKVGPYAGPYMFFYMLEGSSLDKACYSLMSDYKAQPITQVHEDNSDGYGGYSFLSGTAYLMRIPDLSNEQFGNAFIVPVHTETINNESANADYNQNQVINVKGDVTLIPYNYESLQAGFMVAPFDLDQTPTGIIQDISAEFIPISHFPNKLEFTADLKDLERGVNYSYRAYIFDGLNYNYGNICFFKIDDYPNLTLSANSITLAASSCSSIQITSGSGSYSIEKIEPTGVVTANISENRVIIEALTAGTATITVKDDISGETATIEVTVTENSGPVFYLTCPDDHHPHLIDLGLPSGTKWACCNVDSDPTKQTPPNYGGYYAWGETEEKDYYDWSTYIHCDGSYDTCHDLGSDIAGTQYDVAHVNWGGSWVMPSLDQIRELLDNCTYTWTTLNGVNGGLFTGSNGGAIFLPATGARYKEGHVFKSDGAYWSSSPEQSYPSVLGYADFLYVVSYEAGQGPFYAYWGFTVRPVYVDDVDNKSHLQLSTTTLALATGHQGTVEITSGSGSYDAESNAKDVATVTVEGSKVIITAVNPGTAIITVKDDKSGETATIEVTVTENSGSVSYLTCPDDHHPHLIDLGLPSDTKWACCNVDDDHAKQSPTNHGSYYAWGEVEEKDYYDWSTYIHCDGSRSTCHDLGSDISGTQYDVAHVKWGGNWCMPTYDEQMELLINCNSEWTTENGVNGRRFTGPNGNSIFLPAAGYRWDGDLRDIGSYGYYWSSTQVPSDSSYAYDLGFDSGRAYWSSGRCSGGQGVRPVVRN